MGNTLGGWDFFDEMHEQELSEGPRFVNQGIVTKQVFNNDSNILEINSKSGLYPLYITYSLYRERIKNLGELSFEKIALLFKKSPSWARVVFYWAKVQIKEYMEALDSEQNIL